MTIIIDHVSWRIIPFESIFQNGERQRRATDQNRREVISQKERLLMVQFFYISRKFFTL